MVGIVGTFYLTFNIVKPTTRKTRALPRVPVAHSTLYTTCLWCCVVSVTFYQVHSVIEAAVLTCAVTVALTTYAMQTKRDYSPFYAGAFACLCVLIGAGLLQVSGGVGRR